MSTDEKQIQDEPSASAPQDAPDKAPVSESKPDADAAVEVKIETVETDTAKSDSGEESQPKFVAQQADAVLDLSQSILGRHFSTFPISPNRVDALVQQGFTYATRMQSAILDYGLAQLSVCCPLSAGNSRYLPLCISALERTFDKQGLVVIITPTDNLTDLICADLMSFAGGQKVTILPLREADDLDEQRKALTDDVHIMVGALSRVSVLTSELPSSNCTFLGFCDLNKTQNDSAFSELLSNLKSPQQIFGFYSDAISENVFAQLKAFHPNLRLIGFSLASHVHKRQIAKTHDKIGASVAMALATQRSVAFICQTDEEAQELLSALSIAGVTTHLLWSRANRRIKDKIMRQMRNNKVQCLVLTEPNVDRNAASEVVLLGIPENLSSISGFPGTLTWLLSENEDSSGIDSLNPSLIELPSFEQVQADREKRTLDALLQAATGPSLSVWETVAEQVLNHPQKTNLICAALSQFAANARAEGHEMMEDVSRLESKEERKKAPQRRHRRKGRQRRRR